MEQSQKEGKFCRYCQNNHPTTNEFWSYRKGRPDECRIRAKDRSKKHYIENKQEIRAKQNKKRSMPEIRDRLNSERRTDEYRKRHRNQEFRDKRNKKLKQLRKTNPVYFVAQSLRGRTNKLLKIKNESTMSLVGCSVQELKAHLESLFKPGMSWDNYGKYGWHVDHIIPFAYFDLSDPEQVKIVCHYTNLQPLWAEENLRKGSSLVICGDQKKD